MSDKPVNDPNSITLVDVTLSYPQLFKAVIPKGGTEAKYSATFILHKVQHAAQIKRIQEVIAAITTDAFKGKKLPPERIALRDGSLKEGTDGYSDEVMFLTSANSKRPQVVGPNSEGRQPVDAEDSRMTPGCRVNAVVRLWAQDNAAGGKRINGSLSAVQFVRPDKVFGAPPVNVDDAFSSIPESAFTGGDLD